MERLSAREFEGDRLRRPGRYVVAFLADWCPFCRSFEPRFRAREGHLGGTGAVADVTDLSSPLWESFDLEVVPTLVAFEDGRPTGRIDGILGEGLDEAALDRAPAMFGAAHAREPSRAGPR